MPKGFQNGANIDAKTHQKSMQTLVTKKIRKILKNYVSLNGKNIEIHCKSNWFYDLEGCMCERERNHKNIKNETKIHSQIDETSVQKQCSKKEYPKDEQSSTK